MKQFCTVTIEASDTITKTVKSLTYYEEDGEEAKLEDVLLALLEEEFPSTLMKVAKRVFQAPAAIERSK